MKRIIALCLLSTVAQLASAQFYSGNDLNSWSDARDRIKARKPGTDDFELSAELRGYITGVFDTANGVFCPPAGVTIGQVTAIVQKFLREHPERWSEGGNVVVITALKGAFPCRK